MVQNGAAPPRGSAAAAASLRRRITTGGGAAKGASGNMLQFYTDDKFQLLWSSILQMLIWVGNCLRV